MKTPIFANQYHKQLVLNQSCFNDTMQLTDRNMVMQAYNITRIFLFVDHDDRVALFYVFQSSHP